MGKNFFVLDSNISIDESQIDGLLSFLEYPADRDKSPTQNLLDCLSDYGWSRKNNCSLEFSYIDDSDEDFDWFFMESIAGYLKAGSFYEESVDDNQVYGIYVGNRSFDMRLFTISDEDPTQRQLIEKNTMPFKPNKGANPTTRDIGNNNQLDDSFIFPSIDTSYWNLKDKAWVASRKDEWERIEPMFIGGASKSKKGINIIKRYFLKGVMPDWEKLKDWNNYERHLDLFCFLWLHPSSDIVLLKKLCNQYISSKFVTKDDIQIGFGLFLHYAKIMASQEYEKNELPLILNTGGDNELYFKVLIANKVDKTYAVQGQKSEEQFPRDDFYSISTMSKWLCNEKLDTITSDFIYQYDCALDWWYSSCPEKASYFDRKLNKKRLPLLYLYLWRIYNFDTNKEGDSPRSRFVNKMRKILNEREFLPIICEMWRNIKLGIVEIEKPWLKNHPHGKINVSVSGKVFQ